MENLVLLLPVLGCAAMMGVMMWMMRDGRQPARPEGGGSSEVTALDEVAALRREVAALRAQQAGESGPAAGEQPPR